MGRQAAMGLSARAHEGNPISSLFLDMLVIFSRLDAERVFSKTLVEGLNYRLDHAWAEARKGKPVDEQWLSRQLRPYGVQPKTIRIGEQRAKGYLLEELRDVFRRYIPRAEVEAFKAEMQMQAAEEASKPKA